MIFKPALIPAILDGSKTVTRRPVKRNPAGKLIPCRYVVGRDYALQDKRTGKGLGPRLRIVDVTGPARVGDITLADSRREGFDSVLEFATYWKQLYGSWDPDTLVYRIEFEVVPAVEVVRS